MVSQGVTDQVVLHRLKNCPEDDWWLTGALQSLYATQLISGHLDCSRNTAVTRVSKAVRWLVHTWSSGGTRQVLRHAKALSLYARSNALGSIRVPESRSTLLRHLFGLPPSPRGPGERLRFSQVARWARALPAPQEFVVEESLAKHRTILKNGGIPSTTHSSTLVELSEFVSGWARKHRPSPGLPVPHPSTSACWEKSVSKWGQFAATAELRSNQTDEEREEEQRFIDRKISDEDLNRLTGPNREALPVLEGILRDSFLLGKAVERYSKSTVNPKCTRAVIREKGSKARVVTSHELDEILVGQYLRQFAFGALRNWAPTRTSMSGKKLSAVREVVKGDVRGKKIGSADLTSATDLLHQDVAQTTVRAVFDTWGFSPEIVECAVRMMGPHDVYEDRNSTSFFTNHRGILMGNPLTWFVLNLTNYFVWFKANNFKHMAEKSIRISGDDALVFEKSSTIIAYESGLGALGYQGNYLKTFVSPNAGVFTELSFRLRTSTVMVDEPFPRLGEMPNKVKSYRVHAVDPIGDIPIKIFSLKCGKFDWAKFGMSVKDALEYVPRAARPDTLERTLRVVGVIQPNLVRNLIRAGLDPYAPQLLGGVEFPSKKPARWRVSTRRVLGALASGNLFRKALLDNDGELLLSGYIGGAFTWKGDAPDGGLARMLALADFPADRVALRDQIPGFPPPYEGAMAGPWQTQVLSSEDAHLIELTAMGAVHLTRKGKDRNAVLNIRRVGIEVQRRKAKILSSFISVKPVRNNPGALVKRVQKYLDSVFTLPFQPGMEELVNRGRRGRRWVVTHPDNPENREVLNKVIPSSLARAHRNFRRGGA